MSNEVAFRKIHGRIIPIKIKHGAPSKDPRADLKSGAALVAGGVVTSLASGEIAAALVRKSAHLRSNARTAFGIAYRGLKGAANGVMNAQTAFDFGANAHRAARESMIANAVNKRIFSGKLFKSRNLALAAGALLGGSMVAAGLHRINRQAKKRGDVSLGEEVLTNAAGVAAAGLAAGFYYRSLGLKGVSNLAVFTSARLKGAARPWSLPIRFSGKGPIRKGILKF